MHEHKQEERYARHGVCAASVRPRRQCSRQSGSLGRFRRRSCACAAVVGGSLFHRCTRSKRAVGRPLWWGEHWTKEKRNREREKDGKMVSYEENEGSENGEDREKRIVYLAFPLPRRQRLVSWLFAPSPSARSFHWV